MMAKVLKIISWEELTFVAQLKALCQVVGVMALESRVIDLDTRNEELFVCLFSKYVRKRSFTFFRLFLKILLCHSLFIYCAKCWFAYL